MFTASNVSQGPPKSGSLQQTENYIWNTADILGRGATALVYYARHKVTGDVFAVKVFNERASRQPSRQREIESLARLKHPNIVKLLALEPETTNNGMVMVMEYCSGGSLFHLLDQPQYSYGFDEKEFLLFLAHIASGMQYLRTSGYIHRDIKPGNIMRQVGEDGRSIYKLTDFGAARELQDEETFMSIYGTEEYLYPEMYRQAVLQQPGMQEFTSAVDIWSLAVTLYHVATGQLPFQPFGGRKNAQTMHTITTSKPRGCISGIQRQKDGQIEWDSRLPQTCQLSQSSQQMLTVMLAGCLEINKAHMWTFDQFYQTSVHFTNLVSLNIFFYSFEKMITLYVKKEDNIINIQEKIAECTEVPSCDQLLLWHNQDIMCHIDSNTSVQDFPRSILNSPLYLFTKKWLDPTPFRQPHLLTFPDISEAEHLETDASVAKTSAGVAYKMCTVVKSSLQHQSDLCTAEIAFRHYVVDIVKRSEILLPEMSVILAEIRKRLTLCQTSYMQLANLLHTVLALSNDGLDDDLKGEPARNIENTIEQLTIVFKDETLDQLYKKMYNRVFEIKQYVEVLSNKLDEQEVKCLHQTTSCKQEDHCLCKAELLQVKVAAVSAMMSKHKRYGSLHPHEAFIHKCEKQKLQEYTIELWSLTKEHCLKNQESCFLRAQREIGNLTKHYARTQKVDQNVKSVKEGHQQLSTKLDEAENKCSKIVDKLILLIRSHNNKVTPRSSSKPAVISGDRSAAEGAETHVISSEIRRQTEVEKSGRHGNMLPIDSEGVSAPKKQRTVLLDQLSRELLSLQEDSDQLKQLVTENSDFMKRFLCETSNLHIESSLDSDNNTMATEAL